MYLSASSTSHLNQRREQPRIVSIVGTDYSGKSVLGGFLHEEALRFVKEGRLSACAQHRFAYEDQRRSDGVTAIMNIQAQLAEALPHVFSMQ